MADLDLDAIAARGELIKTDGSPTGIVPVGPSERDALVAVARWAQDAPHHDACTEGYGPDGDGPHPCTCGRDEALAPFGGDQ